MKVYVLGAIQWLACLHLSRAWMTCPIQHQHSTSFSTTPRTRTRTRTASTSASTIRNRIRNRNNLLQFATKSETEEPKVSTHTGTGTGTGANSIVLDYGILISSFTDGMTPSTSEFFLYSLMKLLTMDIVQKTQGDIEETTKYSPCQGPNIDLLNKLEMGDALLENENENGNENKHKGTRKEDIDLMLEYMKKNTNVNGNSNGAGQQDHLPVELKVLYIPTAMYALRANSDSSPGKQRQRARADGKKRRNQLVKHINGLDMFAAAATAAASTSALNINVLAVTMDLEDGSIKQPSGSEDASKFPRNGKEALTSWQPHVVYLEGGNTFWLHHCMAKGDEHEHEPWMQLIKDACACSYRVGEEARRPALYIGKSAGAIIAGKYVETATWKGWDDPSVVPGKESYEDWKGEIGLNFAGGASFFPHMSDDWNSLIDEKKGSLPPNGDLYCLQEWDACCIEGSKVDFFIS